MYNIYIIYYNNIYIIFRTYIKADFMICIYNTSEGESPASRTGSTLSPVRATDWGWGQREPCPALSWGFDASQIF